MEIKPSKYNREIQTSKGLMIYNCINNGLLLIEDNDAISKYNKYTTGESPESLDDELYHKLLEGGFLIKREVNEFELIKGFSRYKRYSPSKVATATIAPTINCNLACQYCYQENKLETMDLSTMEAAIDFIKNNLFTEHTEMSKITWFGGEPLLALNVIESISEKIISYCKDRKVKFNASIVTNGVLLNRDVAIKLRELHVKSAQITLDGSKETHDVRRPQKNSNGSFDQIIKNICEIHDILNINLRINLDKTNIDYINGIFDVLEKNDLKNKVKFYFAPVTSNTDNCSNYQCNCYNPNDFSAIQIELFNLAMDRGFKLYQYPMLSAVACGAISYKKFVIGPKGELWKCWHNIGDDTEVVGSIFQPMTFNPALIKWLSWDVFEIDECKNCEVLPLCGGCCPWQWMRYHDKPESTTIPCQPFRYNLSKALELFARQKLQEDSQAM